MAHPGCKYQNHCPHCADRIAELEDALHKVSQHAIGTKGLYHDGAEGLLKSAVFIARQGLWPKDPSKWTDGPHDDALLRLSNDNG